MSGMSSWLMASSFTSGIGSLASGVSNASSIKAQAKYQQDQYDFNKRIADEQSLDAIERGKKAANDVRIVSRRIIGTQRAAYAAQGIELDSGSALEIQQDTATQSKLDSLTIKNNAYREAFGYKTQALGFSMQGTLAGIGGSMNAASSLMTGGLGFLDSINKGMYYGGYYGKNVETIKRTQAAPAQSYGYGRAPGNIASWQPA